MPQPPGVDGEELHRIIRAMSSDGSSLTIDASDVDVSVAMSESLTEAYSCAKAPAALQTAGRAKRDSAFARRVYDFFTSQRDFIRAMTNMAEELRHIPVDERQEALQPRLEALRLPPQSYFPLSTSDEKCCSLLRFTPHESIVFNTKARCPLMLICELKREEFDVATIAAQLSSSEVERSDPLDTSPAISGGEEDEEVEGGAAASDAAKARVIPPTLVEKKREKWLTKVERLRKSSALSTTAGWHLSSFFVKSNDDLRQEVSMQTTPNPAVLMRRPQTRPAGDGLSPTPTPTPIRTPSRSSSCR